MYTQYLLSLNKKSPCMGDFLYLSGRAAQNRTEIKDFGDPYTNRCTTTLYINEE